LISFEATIITFPSPSTPGNTYMRENTLIREGVENTKNRALEATIIEATRENTLIREDVENT